MKEINSLPFSLQPTRTSNAFYYFLFTEDGQTGDPKWSSANSIVLAVVCSIAFVILLSLTIQLLRVHKRRRREHRAAETEASSFTLQTEMTSAGSRVNCSNGGEGCLDNSNNPAPLPVKFLSNVIFSFEMCFSLFLHLLPFWILRVS